MAIANVSGKPIADLVSLKGRVAVVTGGAQGLGRAMVNRLAEAGASVLILDLRAEQAEAAAREVAAATGATVIAAAVDVSDETSVAAAADRAVAELGSLDIWVNNAGLYPNVPLLDVAIADWDKVLAVNLRGVFIGGREAARRMIAKGKGGVIVNVVSTAGFQGLARGVSSYVASKHGARDLGSRWRSNSPRTTSACWASRPPSAPPRAIRRPLPNCPNACARRSPPRSPHAWAGSACPTTSPAPSCSPHPTWPRS